MFYFLGFLFPFPFDRDFNIFCVFLSTMSSPLVFFDSASFLALSPASFPFIDCSSFEMVGWGTSFSFFPFSPPSPIVSYNCFQWIICLSVIWDNMKNYLFFLIAASGSQLMLLLHNVRKVDPNLGRIFVSQNIDSKYLSDNLLLIEKIVLAAAARWPRHRHWRQRQVLCWSKAEDGQLKLS